jgi:hypothetical protein
MTITPVVLGIATLGTPEAAPDCDWAKAATGSIATRKGIMNFIWLTFRFGLLSGTPQKSTTVLYKGKKYTVSLQRSSL